MSSGTSLTADHTPPHSIEAEEYLLSCCLLDGAEVISRCLEARIRPESFYDSKHGIIFERLLDLYNRQAPIDVSVVAEELKTSRQLDAVGGYAFLTQVSSRIPTTAQAGYFVEKVREQALLRAAIRNADGIVEDAHRFSGGIDEFLATSAQRLRSLADSGAPPSAVAEWVERRAGFGRVLKKEVPTLFLRDVPVFNRGNLGLITALQKSGKSAAGGAILGAINAGQDPRGDTLGFRAHNEDGHAVLHLDTEQSAKDHEALIETAKRRADAAQIPPWLYSYGVKGVSAEELRRKLPRLLRELKRAHGGVYVLLLDGVADFVNDPNDAKECNPFVTELEALSTNFDCSVVCVLHLNPAPGGNPTKSRGHIGSQLERKCETDLRLTKDPDGVTTIYTASARHAPIFKKDGPRFSWDSKAEMHLSLAGTNQQAHDEVERDALRELAADCYADSPAPRMRYTALVSAIEKAANCKERTAEEKVARMKKLGVIRVVPPRLLELAA